MEGRRRGLGERRGGDQPKNLCACTVDTDDRGVMARENRGQELGGGGQRGGSGDVCNSVNNKNKEK